MELSAWAQAKAWTVLSKWLVMSKTNLYSSPKVVDIEILVGPRSCNWWKVTICPCLAKESERRTAHQLLRFDVEPLS